MRVRIGERWEGRSGELAQCSSSLVADKYPVSHLVGRQCEEHQRHVREVRSGVREEGSGVVGILRGCFQITGHWVAAR